jgi:hypothetical protein
MQRTAKANKQTLKYPAPLGPNAHQLSQFLNIRTLCPLHHILSCFPHHTCYSSLITTYEVLPKSPRNLNDARKSFVV